MTLRKLVASIVLAAALVISRDANATIVDLGLGVDYLVRPQTGEFNLTLATRAHLTSSLSAGARFGALLTTGPSAVAVPIDLQIRATLSHAYVDLLAGPWIWFQDDFLRAHAAFGFGLRSGGLSLGLELGHLTPGPIVGFRAAFRL